MTINWNDLNLNGMPALLRALETISKEIIAIQNRQALDHSQLTGLEQRISDLELILSEELLAGLAKPTELRSVVEELGAGGRIERQPSAPSTAPAGACTPARPAATTVEDVDRPMAGIDRILNGMSQAFGG